MEKANYMPKPNTYKKKGCVASKSQPALWKEHVNYISLFLKRGAKSQVQQVIERLLTNNSKFDAVREEPGCYINSSVSFLPSSTEPSKMVTKGIQRHCWSPQKGDCPHIQLGEGAEKSCWHYSGCSWAEKREARQFYIFKTKPHTKQ